MDLISVFITFPTSYWDVILARIRKTVDAQMRLNKITKNIEVVGLLSQQILFKKK
jgi:hypothetical protein